MRRLFWTVRRLLQRDTMKQDLALELEATTEILVAEKMAKGMTRLEAERATRLEFGNATQVGEEVRDEWAGARIERLVRDVRYALRGLRRQPGFAVAAILTFGLAIGGTTSIGSMAYALLVRPLPYPNANELMMVLESSSATDAKGSSSSAPNIEDWQRRNTVFEKIAFYEYLGFNLSGGGEAPEGVGGLRTTHELFDVLRATPLLGRALVAADDSGSNGNVVVLSHRLWRSRFHGDSSIIGRSIRLNKQAYIVVGVMRPDLAFPTRNQQLWVPIALSPDDRSRGSHSFLAVARRKPGVTAEQAHAEMKRIGDQMAREFQDFNAGMTVNAFPLHRLWMNQIERMLMLLIGAVALIVVMATVNVAGLMVARGHARSRELAARLALGGSKGRLVAQLLTEGVVIGMLGCVLGVILAYAILPSLLALRGMQLQNIPFRQIDTIGIDVRVLLSAMAIAVVTGALAGAIPALSVIPRAPAAVLKGGDARGATGHRSLAARGLLLSIESALAVVVLIATGLLVNSVSRAVKIDPGLDPRNVFALGVALPQKEFYGKPERPLFCQQLQQESSTINGVQSVSAISHLPLSGANASRGFVIEGEPDPGDDNQPYASYGVACPNYFRTMGIRLVAGEDFSERNTTTSPKVVIVNESFQRKFFPGKTAVGRRIKFAHYSDTTASWITIIGVVADVRHDGLTAELRPYFYRTYSQTVWPEMNVVVKTAPGARTAIADVRKMMARVTPEEPVGDAVSMQDVVDRSLGYMRFPLILMIAFGSVATMLTIVGVFGVASQLVTQRMRELAIRSALGATQRNIYRLVIRQTMAPVVAGIGAGLLVARFGGRVLEGMLYGISASNVATFVVTAFVLSVITVCACLNPARRAAKVNPAEIMRSD